MSDFSVSLFDKRGLILAQIRTAFHCVWTLNKVGKADFEMALNDGKCTEENLQFGNYVLFQHSELGNWAGVIAPNDRQEWDASRKVVRIRALSAEYQFARRRGPAQYLFKGASFGDLLIQVIRRGNALGDMLVREGTIWEGGGPHEETSRDDSLLEILQRVQARAGYDWWLEPQVSGGRLTFTANLSKRRGANSGYVLQEGRNLETPSGAFMLTGGQPLINDLALSGEGATVDARPRAVALDQDSIDAYGLWQGSDSSEASIPATLKQQARERVSQRAQPAKRFKLTAIESPESPDTFGSLGLGDVLRLELFSVGFYAGQNGVSTTVRIRSMEYDTSINKAILVQEEI